MVQLSDFSPDVQRILLDAGWRPEREVDTQHYEQAYRREGFAVLDSALDVLRQFGELEVCLSSRSTLGSVKCFHFNPSEAFARISRGGVALWEEDYATPLCPIGACDNGVITLLINSDGGVIGVMKAQLDWPLGDSIIETIEQLCKDCMM